MTRTCRPHRYGRHSPRDGGNDRNTTTAAAHDGYPFLPHRLRPIYASTTSPRRIAASPATTSGLFLVLSSS